MDSELLKKYGLPAAIAAALMGLVAFMVKQQMNLISDQLEFLSKLVDTVCTGK